MTEPLLVLIVATAEAIVIVFLSYALLFILLLNLGVLPRPAENEWVNRLLLPRFRRVRSPRWETIAGYPVVLAPASMVMRAVVVAVSAGIIMETSRQSASVAERAFRYFALEKGPFATINRAHAQTAGKMKVVMLEAA